MTRKPTGSEDVTPLDESPSATKPTDSSLVIPSSSIISPPPPVCCTSCVSQPFVLLRNYVYNSTIVTYEPRTYHKVSSNPLWQKAMAKELQSLISTHNWDLVDLPPNKSIVGYKRVYKIKSRVDGSIDYHKARLVAKGFT